jgi:Family of unknown function (DUF6455)
MQTGELRSTVTPATRNPNDELLECRMAMLGLDLDATDVGDPATFDAIRQRCASCTCREDCALDLQRDPNSPVWETYCPNAAAFIELAQAWWLIQ